MLSNEFDYELIKSSENFVVIQYEDSIYRGQVESYGSRIRNGFGVIIYNTNRVYEGQWHKDKR